jgi:curved DNA-binding protein CbpA
MYAPVKRTAGAGALSVLGLEQGASEEAIQTAYRNLMKRVHPDKGGSDYLAAKLNLGKDVLTS